MDCGKEGIIGCLLIDGIVLSIEVLLIVVVGCLIFIILFFWVDWIVDCLICCGKILKVVIVLFEGLFEIGVIFFFFLLDVVIVVCILVVVWGKCEVDDGWLVINIIGGCCGMSWFVWG